MCTFDADFVFKQRGLKPYLGGSSYNLEHRELEFNMASTTKPAKMQPIEATKLVKGDYLSSDGIQNVVPSQMLVDDGRMQLLDLYFSSWARFNVVVVSWSAAEVLVAAKSMVINLRRFRYRHFSYLFVSK